MNRWDMKRIGLALIGVSALAAVVIPKNTREALMMEMSSDHWMIWRRAGKGSVLATANEAPDHSYKTLTQTPRGLTPSPAALAAAQPSLEQALALTGGSGIQVRWLGPHQTRVTVQDMEAPRPSELVEANGTITLAVPAGIHILDIPLSVALVSWQLPITVPSGRILNFTLPAIGQLSIRLRDGCRISSDHVIAEFSGPQGVHGDYLIENPTFDPTGFVDLPAGSYALKVPKNANGIYCGSNNLGYANFVEVAASFAINGGTKTDIVVP